MRTTVSKFEKSRKNSGDDVINMCTEFHLHVNNVFKLFPEAFYCCCLQTN